jgi:hypothetical protein
MDGYKDVFRRRGILNPPEFQVGGFDWELTKNANGSLHMSISNDASWRSLLGQRTLSDLYNRMFGGFLPQIDHWPVHYRTDISHGGNIHQFFERTLPVLPQQK